MEEQLPHLLVIAILALAAVTTGLLMVWLKQPPLVGYIIAGVALGPAGIGFMPQVEHVPLVAEFGVLFLLFVIGIEISLKAFIADLRPAVLTAIGRPQTRDFGDRAVALVEPTVDDCRQARA